MTEQPNGAYVWQSLGQPHDYGQWVHGNLLNLIRRPPQLVLDVGCGLGVNGGFLKQQFPSCRVMGVEPVRDMALRAEKYLDHVFCCQFENIDLASAGVQPGEFDLVIFSDVLEHLYHPWQVLQDTKAILSRDGVVLASIPNVRHIKIVDQLIRGEWNYDRSGVMDITHIRFFTRIGVEKLFSETGYNIDELTVRIDPELQQFVGRIQDHTDGIHLEHCDLKKFKRQDIIEFLVLQFLVRASPNR
ncbi:MAG: class I SAM-dependent methyltransferase [Magnetococcales bacterium]|nr:class I SAM-dependent methyltransferase [Magnetococcales bacterium]